MSPQRRTALVSVFAALVLIALKLVAGIHSGSLGLLSEAAHSGTDLVAALLTFFAIGVAGRPPDVGHPYGHGKAENLGALTEAAILVVAALVIAASSVFRLIQGGHEVHVDVPLDQPGGGGEDEHADEERRDSIPLGVAGAGSEQPDEDGK